MIFDGALNIIILLAILVGLVLVHEAGHFVMARRAGVTVHEFGVGFPPRAAILYRGKETIYSLNWLPIGGFVRLEGEEGESTDSRAFVNQGLATRLRILLAGVGVNFVLAWVIFSGIALLAQPTWNIRISEVNADSPAANVALVGGIITGQTEPIPIPDEDGALTGETRIFDLYDESGDVILAIDGRLFPVFDDMARTDAAQRRRGPIQYLAENPGKAVILTVQHADGTIDDVEVTLNSAAEIEAGAGALGILFRPEYGEAQNGIVESVVIGFERTIEASTLILRGVAELVGSLFNDGLGAAPPVAGPVGIVGIVGDVRSNLPPVFMVWLIGLLSANLAVINLLPFPPMDGGRIAMALVQAVSRNRVSPAAERMVYLTGFMMLMALLVWVTVADVQRISSG